MKREERKLRLKKNKKVKKNPQIIKKKVYENTVRFEGSKDN